MLRLLDHFLRGTGRFAVGAPLAGRLRWLAAFVVAFGFGYGAVMGSFTGLAPGRYHQLLFSGVKVPLLLLATFLLCLPSFFVVNTLAGLREDFGEALRAVVATQACVAVVLAALAPFTAVFYLSCAYYVPAVVWNGGMFAVASVTAQVVVRRYYAPLVRRDAAHKLMLRVWLLLYIFVGVQMAWVLRPFIGDPNRPVVFFRQEAWGNAYVVVARLVVHTVRVFVGG
jgi:hypothetical protein